MGLFQILVYNVSEQLVIAVIE